MGGNMEWLLRLRMRSIDDQKRFRYDSKCMSLSILAYLSVHDIWTFCAKWCNFPDLHVLILAGWVVSFECWMVRYYTRKSPYDGHVTKLSYRFWQGELYWDLSSIQHGIFFYMARNSVSNIIAIVLGLEQKRHAPDFHFLGHVSRNLIVDWSCFWLGNWYLRILLTKTWRFKILFIL